MQHHLGQAIDIAEEARLRIDQKKAQAKNVWGEPQPVPEGMEAPLRRADIELKERLLTEAKEIRDEAKERIEREVIDKLPPHATAKDKQYIRDWSCDILGIPPEERGQGDRGRGAEATREPSASRDVSQSRFVDYPPKEAQNPDVAQERRGAESSMFLKQIVNGGVGGGTPPPPPKDPTKDER